MTSIHIATGNAGKLRDFAAAALEYAIEVAPLPGLDRMAAPAENKTTFAGNARLKAVSYSLAAPGLLVLADDSGLEVDALHGAPGVRSARYAADAGFRSTGVVDEDNNLLLLKNLVGVPQGERTARYRCVLALARDGDVLLTSEGTVEGRITAAPRGSGGFGYDPLFFLPQLNRTMAEIDLETKAALSHRGRALRSLLEQMQSLNSARMGVAP